MARRLSARRCIFLTVSIPIRPLRILQQNTALLYIGHRGWMPRKAALRRLIETLQAGDWDLVALSEVFRLSERDQLVDALKKTLPHVVYGPEGSRFPPRLPGGLLLLSRFPLMEPRFCVCRDNAGVDSWANKGLLLARWRMPHWPASLVLALAHTQNPDAMGLEMNRDVTQRQVEEMGRFIAAETEETDAILLMGDLNTDAHERQRTAAPRAKNTYAHLRMQFKGYADLWTNLAPADAPGITFDDAGTFREGMSRSFEHPGRYRKGQRLDYFLARNGTQGGPVYRDIQVEVLQHEPGLEISDHYGLSVSVDGWKAP